MNYLSNVPPSPEAMITKLLEACEKGDFETAGQLISQVQPGIGSVWDGNGWTPLHWACWHGNLNFVRTLVVEYSCDPNCKTTKERSDNNVVAGTTPLHLACRCGHKSIVEYLITVMKCDPECTDGNGANPLHYACGICSQRGYIDVITFLLSPEVRCNPNCTTNDGDTPLSLTTDPAIIRELIRHGANPSDYARFSEYLPSGCPTEPAASRVKVFVIGDSGGGKTSLIEAIKTQAKDRKRFARRRLNRRLSAVECETAGITSYRVESKIFGHVTLYDVSGHKEFYSGHDSLLGNPFTGSSAAVFLLVTDLRMSQEKFKESIMYWLNFINKQYSSLDNKPHVIIIGSHEDEVKSKGAKSRKSNISSPSLKLGIDFPSLPLIEYVEMNTSSAKSSGMTDLCCYLESSCKVLRSKEQMNFCTHCVYVFLRDEYQHSHAIELSTVHRAIREKSESDDVQLLDFVPHSLGDLCSSCEELNERGNILFLKNSDHTGKSWIIPDMTALPSGPMGIFNEYQGLATSTGVVPFSKMATYFPELDPDMFAQFLCHFEFCQEITDPEVLEGLHSALPTAGTSSFPAKFFFFPALVCVEAQGPVWEPDDQFEYHSGWFLNCSEYGQFLTPRFLQVLLHRLAFSFVMIPYANESPEHMHPAIQRKCTFWKNGLSWPNRSGIEALVVVDNLKMVTVLFRCLKKQEIDCIKFRSAIIRKVIAAKKEFCPEVSTTEYFVFPEDAVRYPLKPQSELSLISNTEIAIAIASGTPATIDTKGKMRTIEAFLHYEPYAHLGNAILQPLFLESSPTQCMPDAFLTQVARCAHTKGITESLIQIFKPYNLSCSNSFDEMIQTLLSWRSQNSGTYQNLRMELDKFSVFASRNPLEIARENSIYLPQNEPCSVQSQPHFEESIPPSSSSQLHHESFDEKKRFLLTGHPRSVLEWSDHGFKLYIPENALPSGIGECPVDVKTCLTGEFPFPNNAKLVSGVYWVDCPSRLTKDATIEIEHCARITDTYQVSSLSFVTAACSGEELLHPFERAKGEFAPNSSYGSISVEFRESFMLGAVGLLSVSNRYTAQVFYEEKHTPNTWMVHFVIVKDLQLCRNSVTRSYTDRNAKPGSEFDIEFKFEDIELDIEFDPEGTTLENGWNITPLSWPMITKEQADYFAPGRRIPSCQLQVKWTGSGEMPLFIHRVDLPGAVPEAFPLDLGKVEPPPPPHRYSPLISVEPPPPPHRYSPLISVEPPPPPHQHSTLISVEPPPPPHRYSPLISVEPPPPPHQHSTLISVKPQAVPIIVFNPAADYTSKTVYVEEGMTSTMACQILAVKNEYDMSPNLVLVEQLGELSLERELEDHEMVADVYNTWPPWPQKHDNRFLFKCSQRKYDLFQRPMEYFSSTNQVPELEGWLLFKDGYEADWIKVHCILTASGLYYSNQESVKYLVLVDQFEDYQIYNGINFEKILNVPTELCFALKPHQFAQIPGPNDIKVLRADSKQEALYWTAGIRLAKYGDQLQHNFFEATKDLIVKSTSREISPCSPILCTPTPPPQDQCAYDLSEIKSLSKNTPVKSPAKPQPQCSPWRAQQLMLAQVRQCAPTVARQLKPVQTVEKRGFRIGCALDGYDPEQAQHTFSKRRFRPMEVDEPPPAYPVKRMSVVEVEPPPARKVVSSPTSKAKRVSFMTGWQLQATPLPALHPSIRSDIEHFTISELRPVTTEVKNTLPDIETIAMERSYM